MIHVHRFPQYLDDFGPQVMTKFYGQDMSKKDWGNHPQRAASLNGRKFQLFSDYIYIESLSLSIYMYSDIIIIHLVLSIQICMYTYFGR